MSRLGQGYDRSTKRLYLFFGCLTIWTMAGPTLAAVSLMGGDQSSWPPENRSEWLGFSLVVVIFVSLMGLTFRAAHELGGFGGGQKTGKSNSVDMGSKDFDG